MQDDALVRTELVSVVRTRGIRVELKHSSGQMDCPWDGAILDALLSLSKIDENGLPIPDLSCNLVNCEILDCLLRRSDQFCGRLCVSSHSIPPCSSPEPSCPALLLW